MSEQPTNPDEMQDAQFDAEAAQAAQRVVDGAVEYSQDASNSLDYDYKHYTQDYRLADSREAHAEGHDQEAQKYHDLADRSDELLTDPKWQEGRGKGHTPESLKENLEKSAASYEEHARYARRNAEFDRLAAENVTQDNARKQYEKNPDAFYHAAVADAHMNGVHINTGERPSHATDVHPIQPTELSEQPPQDL